MRGASGRAGAAFLCWLGLASTLGAFVPGYLAHARLSADPWRFNDDARGQVAFLLRHDDESASRADYIADYFLAALPIGYRWIYAAAAHTVDPRTLAKAIPYAALAVLIGALAATAWTLAGPAAAWGTAALCLSSDAYLARMTGGLPRSFGDPLIALAILALARDRPLWLCALAVVAAALYYPAAILIAGVAGAQLLIGSSGARSWSIARRFAALGAMAIGVAVMVLPVLVATRPFGPVLRQSDWKDYPEAGVGGRYEPINLPVGAEPSPVAYLAEPLFSGGLPWLARFPRWPRDSRAALFFSGAVGGAALAGLGLLWISEHGVRRIALLPLAAFASHALASAAWPQALPPERYFAHTLPLVSALLVPVGLVSLARRVFGRSSPMAPAIAAAAVAAVVLLLGARGPGAAGLTIEVPERDRPLYAFLAKLPADVLIAGWPNGAVDSVPLLSGRRILVGFEVHQAFHKRYVEEMRRRTLALIDAYFADDPAPLLALSRDFGVTHLIVDRDDYRSRTPAYFAPFGDAIEKAMRSQNGTAAALRMPAVFDDGRCAVLDLRQAESAGAR